VALTPHHRLPRLCGHSTEARKSLTTSSATCAPDQIGFSEPLGFALPSSSGSHAGRMSINLGHHG
jgi:hypothetical protein